jgi:hypothetical protein
MNCPRSAGDKLTVRRVPSFAASGCKNGPVGVPRVGRSFSFRHKRVMEASPDRRNARLPPASFPQRDVRPEKLAMALAIRPPQDRPRKTAAKNRAVRSAVHQHKHLSKQGLLERAFTFAFRGLVYAQIWEDPAVDMEALAITPDSHVVTIASGA